jgi:hypothetical protein
MSDIGVSYFPTSRELPFKTYPDFPEPFKATRNEAVILRNLLTYLQERNFTLDNGRLILDDLLIETRERLQLNSKEHLVLNSGRNKNKQHGINNSVLINHPTKDGELNFNQHVPFKHWRARPKVKRPKTKSNLRIVRHAFCSQRQR